MQKKAQSIIEYLLMITVAVLAIMYGVKGPLKDALVNYFNSMQLTITKAADDIYRSM